MKSKTSGSHLTAISLLKLTSTTFVALPHALLTTSEKLGTFYLDLLRNVLFMHLSLQNLITATAFFTVYLPSYELEKLQRLQNTAARLIVRAKKSAHITPVLKSLHWFPVKERIIFNILLVTYKIRHNFAPAYLNELLFNYTPHRLLRSSSLNLLSIPKTKTVTYGDRSFSVIAPKLWNDLPIIIKQCSTVDSFKSRLKAFLFNRVYS